MTENLLKETIEAIEWNESSVADVQWVGSVDGTYVCTWEQFTQLADFEYDDGYGAQEIASDLVVVGTDWWLERHEYDGAERWEHKSLPIKSETPQPIKLLSVHPVKEVGWKTLDYLHEAAKPKV
jgi:hypothetical protein